MRRAISNKNVLTAKFEVAEFDGEFLASFGKPELRGAWLIYGGSGCGKTTFVMQMCKYLTRFRRVAYNSLEQGLSLSLQKAWERVGMQEVGNKIILLNKESLKANGYTKVCKIGECSLYYKAGGDLDKICYYGNLPGDPKSPWYMQYTYDNTVYIEYNYGGTIRRIGSTYIG